MQYFSAVVDEAVAQGVSHCQMANMVINWHHYHQAPRSHGLRRSVGRDTSVNVTAAFQGCSAPLARPIKVVGMGSCAVDYLASVAAFPKPDEKLRTETLETQGGGNCANALTAAARLGLSPLLVSKIGGDGLGDGIISELIADGVDTSLIMRAHGHPSPFSYIIVDRQGGTRTCIHTPGAALLPEEMQPALIQAALEDAALVYFDGRLTEAALLLAQQAKAQGIPVLVEAERLRPGLEALMGLADYVVTSAHFPQDWTGETSLPDAVLALYEKLSHVRFVITTMGTRGAVLLERLPGQAEAGAGVSHEQSMADVLELLQQQALAETDSAPACMSARGISIPAGATAQTQGVVRLRYSASRDPTHAAQHAAAAAARAATLNAQAGQGSSYGGNATASVSLTAQATACAAQVTFASIASLPQGAVVDTTGAGDSFIGSVLYGLTTGMPRPAMLRLASLVAACKCTALGARQGLPSRQQLTPEVIGMQ